MLFETVAALATAGHAALSALRPGAPCSISVSQLDQGQLSFPSLAVLRINGHSLGFVQVGADGDLRNHLLEMADSDGRLAGAQVLAEGLLNHLTEALPARHARGRVEHLALAPVSLFTRGVRTFGLRCRTDVGQLFLLAEIPSIAERERERGSDVIKRMVDGCLPANWSSEDEMPDTAGSGLTDYLRRSEADVNLMLPSADGALTEKAAILLTTWDKGAEHELAFAVPVDAAMRARLDSLGEVRARVGVEDRSIEFAMDFRVLATHDLPGGIRLSGLTCGLPRGIRVVQSRRSFRIAIQEQVDVEVEVDDPGVAPVTATLADISFSGARLVYADGQGDDGLAVGDRIHCSLCLPGEAQQIELHGRVRRVGRNLDELARPRVEIGVEFDATGAGSAAASVRHFVLSQQRHRLARRVHVTGVSDW